MLRTDQYEPAGDPPSWADRLAWLVVVGFAIGWIGYRVWMLTAPVRTLAGEMP